MVNDSLFDELNNAEIVPTSTKQIKREKKQNSETTSTKHYEMNEVDRRQKNLLQVYRNEPKAPVRIAPSYAKYFGRTMRTGINGIVVTVRCDGKQVMLPRTFAAEAHRRMAHVDAQEARANKMSEFQRNSESSPGSLNFFG